MSAAPKSPNPTHLAFPPEAPDWYPPKEWLATVAFVCHPVAVQRAPNAAEVVVAVLDDPSGIPPEFAPHVAMLLSMLLQLGYDAIAADTLAPMIDTVSEMLQPFIGRHSL